MRTLQTPKGSRIILANLDEVPQALRVFAGEPFATFLLAFGAQDVAGSLDAAKGIAAAGCGRFICYGPDAESLHDAIDWEVESLAGKDDRGSEVVTTWHDREPIGEVMDFFLTVTALSTEIRDYLVALRPESDGYKSVIESLTLCTIESVGRSK